MSLLVNIKKQLGDFHLQVEFESEDEIVALLGSSGCGKSMTLKCIAGIETPDSGEIILNGKTLFDSKKHINLKPQARKTGYLFQQYALFPNMTVYQNIAAGIRDKRLKKDYMESLMETFHLSGQGNKYPRQLSGGQQQRVALARILASSPEILLLDEPFSALDSYIKWQLELEVSDTMKAFGGDVVFVSHSRDEVYRLCDSVCVITEGKSEEKLPIKSMFEAPKTVSACLISGCKNFSDAAPDGDYIIAPGWNCRLYAGGRALPDYMASIGVRAHYIRPASGETENVLSCHIDRVIEDVFSIIIMLTPRGGTEHIRMELQKEVWRQYCGAEYIDIYIPPDAIMILKK